MVDNLRLMERYCLAASCRHRLLVEHFGQAYENDNCAACDACLDQLDLVADPLILAQKILSCVVRCGERFGGQYIAQVLHGSKEACILDNGHDRLSTYKLLKEHKPTAIRAWIEQLIGQGCLEPQGEYRTLAVTPRGREVLRGQWTPRLLEAASRTPKAASRKPADDGPYDVGLFEHLRQVRRDVAEQKGVAAFVVFGDVTLRDLARRRPTTLDGFRAIHGVGDRKAADLGETFLAAIHEYCEEHDLATDVDGKPAIPAKTNAEPKPRSAARQQADALFQAGQSISMVSAQLQRAESTVLQYLVEFLKREGRTSPEPWVDAETFARIAAAAQQQPDDRLQPLHDQFAGEITYEQLRIAVTCIRNLRGPGAGG
jgi:ATP-dependent DNA helicase RecQ